MRWIVVAILGAVTSPVVAGGGAGVVIEEVTAGTGAAQVGLQSGDVLFRWERAGEPLASREAAAGSITHPFDLWVVRIEQAPRGAVTLSGERNRQGLTVRLPEEEWKLRVRPHLDSEELEIYLRGRELLVSGQVETALATWQELALAWESEADDRAEAAWLLFQIADLELQHDLGDGGREIFERAVALIVEKDRPEWLAELYRRRGETLESRAAWDRIEELNRAALEAHEEESLAGAASLTYLGIAAAVQGDLAAGERLFRRSLAIQEKHAPESLHVAWSLNNLANISWYRGSFASAESFYQRALSIRERLAPDTLDVAASLHNLGILAGQRGDLAGAEGYLQRSLRLRERLAPDTLLLASNLDNLAVVATRRGELVAAIDYQERALRIQETLAPDHLDVAGSLHNLGVLALRRGDSTLAGRNFQRSLAIRERLAPGSLDVAESLVALGTLASHRGHLIGAEGHYRAALEIQEKHAPQGLDIAETLHRLGITARDREHLVTAVRWLQRALAIRTSLAPESGWEAESLYEMAQVRSRQKQSIEARALLYRALTAIESQSRRLGGSKESRGTFLTQYGKYYKDTLELLLDHGQGADAYHVLERSRVRGLLAMLAERDLVFSTDLPEELRQQQVEANTEHDRVLDQLRSWTAALDQADDAKARLRQQLASVRRRQADIESKVRAASPRLAALQYPEPLTVSETLKVLDPGTVLLAYSIGEKKSHLFVVSQGSEPLAVVPLEITLEGARQQVEHFRDMWKPGGRGNAWMRLSASELGESLLQPAARWIASSERLVILPEGPLHYLPFAALKAPGTGENFHYLIESKPVSVVASATLLAQLRSERQREFEARIAVFADPRYPATISGEKTDEPILRTMARHGHSLQPLPGTRAEAAALERVYSGSAVLYLGEAASEERAKTVGTAPSVLHFAIHGLVDDREPLSSALALSIPETWRIGQENGLLQAWEILEQVRLDADLVTLSACNTALGKDGGGEGLLGLTRAFQYAGARTVLASLWAVSDESTAALMERFYGHLKSGKSKDEALRYAQLELLAGPIMVGEGDERRERDFSHPFFWAAFQVIGDWK